MKILDWVKMKRSNPYLLDQIESSEHKLRQQLEKLSLIEETLLKRDKELFEKCVEAEKSGNGQFASIYANECAEIRKILRAILRSKLSIEQVATRFRVMAGLSELFVEMDKVRNIARQARVKLEGIPLMARGIKDIQAIISGILPEEPEVIATPPEEAERTLAEAMAIAEQRAKARFPITPVAKRELEEPVKIGLGGTERRTKHTSDFTAPLKDVESLISQLKKGKL